MRDARAEIIAKFFKLKFNEKDTGVDIELIVKPDVRSAQDS
jgi:hypothetical protein